MRIEKIIAYHVRLPLKISFTHARASRRDADNIVVETVTETGVHGFGEGVPREYVTGETPRSAMRYLEGLDLSSIGEDGVSFEEGIDRLEQWETSEKGGGPVFPGAARCALGLSLLDALSKSHGARVADIAGWVPGLRQPGPEEVRYSAVCSGGSLAAVARKLIAFRLYGFRAVKLKVGWGPERDEKIVRLARAILGKGVDIRVDANGAWDTETAARTLSLLEPLGISSVEEPLSPACVDDLPWLRRETGIPVMLDESVSSLAQLEHALRRDACDSVNIRLSKCGGFFASLRLAGLLRERGKGYQLGCQVGETGILSAAGRHFAFLVPGIGQIEGSYDRHLLRANLIREDITFGYGGRAGPLGSPGLGVSIDRVNLDKFTVEKSVITSQN